MEHCGPCGYRGIKKKSEFWCPDCDDPFCSICNDHHSGGKITRDHVVIPIENYRKLPEFARKLSSNCERHSAPYQNYCVTHEELCCRKCIDPKHTNCQGLPALDDFLENTRYSFAIEKLEETLKNIVTFCEDAICSKKQEMKDFRSKANEIEAKIQIIRIRLNTQLDKLLTDVRNTNSINEAETQGVIQKLSQHHRETKEFQENVTALTQYASNIQLFLASKHINGKLKVTEDNIVDLQSRGKFNRTRLIFNESPLLSSLQKSHLNLASTTVKHLPCPRMFKTETLKTQHMITITSRPISTMRLALHRRIRFPNEISITGCLMLPNKGILLTGDFCVYFLDTNGCVTKTLQLRMTYDLTLIDNKTIAVTDDDSVTFVDIDRKEVKSKTKANGYAFGISKLEGTLIYTTDKAKIKELNIATNVVSELNINDPIFQSYVTTSRNKIYYSNWNENSVSCFKHEGLLNWSFRNETVLKKPSGVTADLNGNIFVAGLESQNIVLISANGKHYKEVKTDSAGLRNPRTIYFCKENKLLLVCSERMFAAIYTVE